MKLAGKVAVITGAARGIGRACVERFLSDGAKVVAADIDADALGETVAALSALGEIVAAVADVSKRADVEGLIATAVKTFGRLDVMLNNAGIAKNQPFLEISEADYDSVLGVNLKGAFFGTQAAGRQMIAQGGGGIIINMSSVNALLANPEHRDLRDLEGRTQSGDLDGRDGVRALQHPRRRHRAGHHPHRDGRAVDPDIR